MKFLVAYTGSRESKAALELAGHIARATGAVVVVMTSMEGGSGETADEVGKAEYELSWARRFLQDQGVGCEVQSLARGLSPGRTWCASSRRTPSTTCSSASRRSPGPASSSWGRPPSTSS